MLNILVSVHTCLNLTSMFVLKRMFFQQTCYDMFLYNTESKSSGVALFKQMGCTLRCIGVVWSTQRIFTASQITWKCFPRVKKTLNRGEWPVMGEGENHKTSTPLSHKQTHRI